MGCRGLEPMLLPETLPLSAHVSRMGGRKDRSKRKKKEDRGERREGEGKWSNATQPQSFHLHEAISFPPSRLS